MQIRLEDKERYIWIDALCINQANVHERNHQVQIMGKIYKGAEKVIVWLGLAKDDSDFAMEMIKSLHDFFNKESVDQDLNLVDSFQIIQYRPLLALCQRSYWRRVWILQEIYLARNFVVHCGSKSISNTALNCALAITNRFDNRDHFRQISSTAANQLMIMKRLHGNVHTLGRFIRMCLALDSVSTEPRDFIYAMLGIASDCQHGELLPDYKKPLLEVYIDTITLCKQPGFGLEKLAHKLAGKLGLTIDEDIQRLISKIEAKPDNFGRIAVFIP